MEAVKWKNFKQSACNNILYLRIEQAEVTASVNVEGVEYVKLKP
jgi:hypothetical protein